MKSEKCNDHVYRNMQNRVFHVPYEAHILNMIKTKIPVCLYNSTFSVKDTNAAKSPPVKGE